jgi:hypothetical protein
MARHVKISCLCSYPCHIDSNIPYIEAVNIMIKHWESKIERVLPDKPDLIVLPEACDRPQGYPVHLRHEYYRVRGDSVLDFFCRTAKANDCYIAYPSHRVMEDGSLRNSVRMIDRNGNIVGIYNKNHVGIDETEFGILRGKDAPIIQCDFGRVACVICFDLNFDELRLKYVKGKPDLIIFPSYYHGSFLQSYWAYTCRSYFVGAIGGRACTMVTPLGKVIASNTENFDFITTMVNLDYVVVFPDDELERIDAMRKKYGPYVIVREAVNLDAVLITSESPDTTAREMAREFGIELIDEFYVRSLAHNHNPDNIEK